MKVLITGDSRGLGKAIGTFLMKEGCEVFGISSSEADVPWQHQKIDLSNVDPSTVNGLEECDILINNAAVGYDGLLSLQSDENIEKLLSINLLAPIRLLKYWSKHRLKRREPGKVINISSICGIRGYAGLATYAASKSAMDGMTRALARELGPKNILVNSVLPGYMETDMSSGLSKDQKSMIIRRTPIKRLVSVDEVAEVVGFLVLKSTAITGQSIVIDGGITI